MQFKWWYHADDCLAHFMLYIRINKHGLDKFHDPAGDFFFRSSIFLFFFLLDSLHTFFHLIISVRDDAWLQFMWHTKHISSCMGDMQKAIPNLKIMFHLKNKSHTHTHILTHNDDMHWETWKSMKYSFSSDIRHVMLTVYVFVNR